MLFSITPPGCQCPMEHTAFNAYAYHQQKVEDFINALAATDNPNDYWNQRYACRQSGASISDFSDEDIDYIEREVAKRR